MKSCSCHQMLQQYLYTFCIFIRIVSHPCTPLNLSYPPPSKTILLFEGCTFPKSLEINVRRIQLGEKSLFERYVHAQMIRIMMDIGEEDAGFTIHVLSNEFQTSWRFFECGSIFAFSQDVLANVVAWSLERSGLRREGDCCAYSCVRD